MRQWEGCLDPLHLKGQDDWSLKSPVEHIQAKDGGEW